MSEPKPDTTDKPIRVMEGEVVVGKCPLCTKPLLAQVEVEVRLGALTIGKAVDEETGEIPVDVSAEPRIRKLTIEHECKAPTVKPRTRKPRTPRTPGRCLPGRRPHRPRSRLRRRCRSRCRPRTRRCGQATSRRRT